MKIAFAMINCNRRDGSARAVNEVAERLAWKHDVHLFARKADDIDLTRIQWRKMPGIAWPEVADFGTYHLLAEARIRPKSFDIIHSIGCNAAAANVITIQNIQPAKQRVLERLGSAEQVSLPRRLTRALYLNVTCAAERRMYTHQPARKAPLFLPVSRGVEAELRTHYDIGPAPVRIVPNAADIGVFKPVANDARELWRESQGFAAEDILLIFSGGEWMRKGLDFALRALALLPQSHVKLFVAGDDPDRLRYKTLASELGLEGRVVFGGFRADIALALASCDLFLFPSWYEAFSLATIEAAACGLPIIATSISGTEDFVRPGETGEFIVHDPKQIAAVLRPLIENPECRLLMGANARRLVEQNYTWDRVAQMTEEAYVEYLTEGESRVAVCP